MAGPRKTKLTPMNEAEQMGEIKATLNQHGDMLNSIDSEMKEMNKQSQVMNSTLIRNTEQLEIHIKRSNTLEQMHVEASAKVDERIIPLEKHATQVNFLGKMIIACVGAPAAIYYIAQLVRMIMGKI